MISQIKQVVAQFFLSAIGIYLISLILPEFYIENFLTGIFFTLVVLLQTLLFWPLLFKFAKRFLFITFIIGSFLLSVIIVWLADLLLPGVTVSTWGLVTTPLAINFVSAIVIVALKIDDDVYAISTHYSLKKRAEKSELNKRPGFIFIGIDGLSEKVLKMAIEKGAMPTLASWLKNGSYRIKSWETDFSSQTGAGLAGILHGCNKDIPAFRWVDKSDDNRIVSANGIGDGPKIQEGISDGQGLLSVKGAAIVSLFSCDSEDNILVYSKLKNIRQLYSESWSAVYSKPFNLAHIVVLFLVEILLDLNVGTGNEEKKFSPASRE